MSTIDAAVSMMREMSEAEQIKVLDYVKLVYSVNTAPSPFKPLSADELSEKLEIGREQNNSGKGASFDEAMKRIGIENEYI